MNKILYPNQIKYLEGLREEKNKLILEMETYAKENRIPILNWNAAEFLEQMIRIHKPKRVLEIGTAIGYSSIRIAKHLPSNSVLDTIELSNNINHAKKYIKKSKLEIKINLIEGDALKLIPLLKKKYGFIFLDADKEDYVKLFQLSFKLLKKGGVFFVDNLLWQGFAASSKVPSKFKESTKHIRSFNKIFTSNKSLQSTILPIGDGIGIGIKLK